MNTLDAWLAERRPPPPEELTRALGVEAEGTPLEALTAAGVARLAGARARPGRVRESAFRLLEADALLTYACEAALETTDPRGALGTILAAVGSSAGDSGGSLENGGAPRFPRYAWEPWSRETRSRNDDES